MTGMLALFCLPVLLVIGGLVYLSTHSGGERVRQLVVQGARDALQGALDVREVSLQGDRLLLRGLVLKDPEGNVVAEIEEVEAILSLPALAEGHLVLREARVMRPRLYLKQDERGLNLSRAIAARNPKPEAPAPAGPAEKSSVVARLDQLRLVEGYVEFEQDTGEETPRRFRLEELAASLQASVDGPREKLDSTLSLTGKVMEPLQGPLALDVKGAMEGEAGGAGVTLTLAGLKLDAAGRMKGPKQFELDLNGFGVEPTTVRAFVPDYPLQKPASLTGKVALRGDVVESDLVLAAGTARVTVKGSADLARQRTDGLTVTVRDVNLEELIPDGPQTSLALDLDAKGGGTRLEDLDGEVRLSVPAVQVEGQPLGPVRVEAKAQHGRFRIEELLARLPGLSVSGEGQGDLRTLSVSGKVDARDLSALARAVGRLTGQKAPRLSGHGDLAFSVRGATDHPSLTLEGSLASLKYEDKAVKELSLSVDLADVRRPWEAQADIKAKVIQLGARSFKDVSAKLETKGRAVQADFSTKGLADLVVHVGGTLEKGQEAFTLSSLEVRYPEAAWALQAPARVRFGGNVVSAEPITLAAGPQRLSLSGSRRGQRLEAAVELERLDLSKLPGALVDPELGVSGQLDARVRAQGSVSNPAVEARLTLKDGAYQQYRQLGLTLDARYARSRAQGTLSATSEVTGVDASFDIPVRALLRRRPEPLRFTLDVHELEIERALAVAGRREPYAGRVQAQIALAGTARDPLLRAWVRGRGIRSARFPGALQRPNFDLVVESGPEAKLGARLDLESAGSSGVLAVRTPYTLGQLLRRVPTGKQLRDAPFEVDLDLRDLDLQLVHALGAGPEMKGRLSMQLEARGSLRAPTANAHVLAEGLSLEAQPPTRVELVLQADHERIQATLQADRPGISLARLNAAVGAPLARAMDPDALPTLPFTLDGTVGPVALSELRPPAKPVKADPFADVNERQTRQVNAVVQARLSADGTLADPKLQLRAQAGEVHLGSACVGNAVVDYDYSNAVSTLKARLQSRGSGSLALDGKATLDLSYPAVRRGLDTDAAPITATLNAKDLDLSLFNGFVPKTRDISGRLRADATVEGTVSDPVYRAEVEWKDGRVATTGYGEFKQVHLLAVADNQRLQLKDLSAASGGGDVRLAFDVKRTYNGFVVTGKGDARRFPVVLDDQLMAVASLAPTVEGQATGTVWDLRLAIPRADVELPEVQRKDLQDLDRPDDVLLVRDGEYLDKRRAKKLAERRAGPAAAKPAEAEQQPKAGEDEEGEEAGTEYRITIDAPKHLFIRGTDVNAELGLSEGFRVEYADRAHLQGEVFFLDGKVNALGRKFNVDKGSSVKFSGAAKKPYTNLTAVHLNEREQVKVKITIRGEGKDISFKPTSEPPLAESEIYTLLATGRRTLKRGSGASMSGADAASIVGSLAAAQLKRTLASKVPLDVLSIEAGDEGSLTGARLEAGTYITDKFYVGYTGRLGANPTKENTNAVRLEYQISPRWSAEGECGDARVCGADLIWSRDF